MQKLTLRQFFNHYRNIGFQKQAADQCGVSESYISQMIDGHRPVNAVFSDWLKRLLDQYQLHEKVALPGEVVNCAQTGTVNNVDNTELSSSVDEPDNLVYSYMKIRGWSLRRLEARIWGVSIKTLRNVIEGRDPLIHPNDIDAMAAICVTMDVVPSEIPWVHPQQKRAALIFDAAREKDLGKSKEEIMANATASMDAYRRESSGGIA